MVICMCFRTRNDRGGERTASIGCKYSYNDYLPSERGNIPTSNPVSIQGMSKDQSSGPNSLSTSNSLYSVPSTV